jgi:hypothetical protein
MESKVGTPQQILRAALEGSPSSNGRKERPVKVSRTSMSPLLDNVRARESEALNYRTSRRMRELQEEAMSSSATAYQDDEENLSDHMETSPSQEDRRYETINESSSSKARVPATEARRNITQRRSRGRAKDAAELLPRADLLTRRPRERAQDRRYSSESMGGLEDCERRDWRATSARFLPRAVEKKPSLEERSRTIHLSPYAFVSRDDEQDRGMDDDEQTYRLVPFSEVNSVQEVTNLNGDRPYVTGNSSRENSQIHGMVKSPVPFSSLQMNLDQRMDSGPIPFLRRDIPTESENPELHKSLTEKWYRRQEAARGLGDALANDDSQQYQQLLVEIAQLNQDMHSDLKEAMMGGKDLSFELPSSSESPIMPEEKYRHVDSLLMPESRGGDKDEFTSLPRLKRSFKDGRNKEAVPLGPFLSPGGNVNPDIDTAAFMIQFVYQEIGEDRIVNDNMPL